MSDFDSKNVKVIVKKSPVTKIFKIISSVAAGVVGTVGSIAIGATSVVSALGYYEHDKVITSINDAGTKINNSLTSSLSNVVNGVNSTIQQIAGSTGKITKDNIPEIMVSIEEQFKSHVGVPMPSSVAASIESSLEQLLLSTSVDVSTITSNIKSSLESATSSISGYITNIFEGIVEVLYGQQVKNSDGTTDYSKLYIWRIVFITTITIVSILVMAGTLYLIAYLIDKCVNRKHVKKAKEALKNLK